MSSHKKSEKTPPKQVFAMVARFCKVEGDIKLFTSVIYYGQPVKFNIRGSGAKVSLNVEDLGDNDEDDIPGVWSVVSAEFPFDKRGIATNTLRNIASAYTDQIAEFFEDLHIEADTPDGLEYGILLQIEEALASPIDPSE